MTDDTLANADNGPTGENLTPAATITEDEALGAVWDKNVRDNGAERENGKFVSPDPEKRAEQANEEAPEIPAEGEGEAVATDGAPPTSDVPLPSNWSGMDEVWAKIPADVRGPIAAHAAKLHSTLSEQGRKLAGYAPIQEVVNEYADYFDGRVKDENGQPITVAGGIKYLFGMQRAMDTNAVQTLLEIADAYKARDGLIAVLSGQARPEQFQRQQAPQNAAGLSPADVQALVKQAVEESTTQTTVKQVVEQWAADKPHYAAVEADLPQFIALARQRLGEDAAAVAILDQAYELAVFANPSLRPTLMTAASAMPAAAPVVDGRKAEAARRANAVNVTSTASGKSRPLTEDEELAAIYDKAQKAS